MKKRMPGLSTPVAEELDIVPHVLPQLNAIVLSGSRHTHADLEHVLGHLVTCVDCQHALRVLVALKLRSAPSDEAVKTLRKLLGRLTKIVHVTQAQEKLGAYIDTLEEQGEEQANRKFPVLAEHFRHCKACHRTIEGILASFSDAQT
jgi:hypothetical protein